MSKVLPPVYFLVALAVMAILHFFWPVTRYLSLPGNLIGLLPLVIGIALNVAADRQFKHHQTTVKPFERSSALVTAFPFSLSRNPMYVGITLMLAGVALLLGTVSPLLPVAAFAILMDIHFVRMEERMLAEAFGSEWDNYRARVRRWL
jgi:protein-S-isoprenylcysteine O-methyltransferase Ste14